MRRLPGITALVCCLVCGTSGARAQAPLLDQQARSALWIDVMRPWFTTGGSRRPSSSRRVSAWLWAHASRDRGGAVRAGRTARRCTARFRHTHQDGQPVLRGALEDPDTGVQLEFGGRPPLLRSDTTTIDAPAIAGTFGDADRFDAYTPDLATILGRITKTTVSEGGFEARVTFGIKAALPVRDNPSKTFIYGVGGAVFGYMRSWIELLGGLTATARLNGVSDPLNDSVSEQLQFGAMLRTRYVRPSIGLRIPLSQHISGVTRFVLQGGLVVDAPLSHASLAGFVALWTAMMAAMMLPSLIPTVLLFRSVTRSRGALGFAPVPSLVFVAGYFVAWAALGVLVGLLSKLAPMDPDLRRYAAAGGLVIGGIYQLTPLKARCLGHCRSPMHFFMAGWRDGPLGALRLGTHHGLYCVACCWGLMTALIALA